MKNLLLIPGPVADADDVLAAMARPMINHRGPAFAQLLGSLEERMRPLFGTSSDVVLLGGSGTSGIDGAIACSFSPGQRVLACPIGGAWAQARQHHRQDVRTLEVDVIETELGGALDPAALAARLRARIPRTRMPASCSRKTRRRPAHRTRWRRSQRPSAITPAPSSSTR